MSHTPHKIHSAGNTHCQNCNTELKGPFCHECGQHDFDLHRSFGHTFLEVLESFLHFDGKILRETTTLLFRPGQLTKEFNSGKRASHIPPLRFYIFVSLVFFLWLGKWGDHDVEITKGLDTGKAAREQVQGQPAKAQHAADDSSEKVGTSTEAEGARVPNSIETKFQKLAEDPEHYREEFLHLVPKMLLICLPLFALATRALFRKADLTYLQHLVASLHLHTFVFLFWMLASLIEWPLHHLGEGVATVVGLGFVLYWCYYVFSSLRTLYGGSRLKVFAKSLILALAYGITLAVGFGIVGSLSVAK